MINVRLDQKGHICIISICRQEALNALNSSVIQELKEAFDQVLMTNCRCVILTGEGEKAFVAGADIAEMKSFSSDEARVFSKEGNALMEKIESFPIPVIAAINGYALGGGFELALSCDIRLAADTACFAFPETSLGIIPGYGGMQRLARLVGSGKAKFLVFSSNRIRAEEAYRWGFIEKVYAYDQLQETAMRLAEQIAENAPVAVGAAKQVINLSLGKALEQTSSLEVESFAKCFNTNDHGRRDFSLIDISERNGVSKVTVWNVSKRYVEGGLDAVLHRQALL